MYFDEAKDLDKYIKIANKHNSNCTQENILGHGLFGVAFKISDSRVLKITGDKGEVVSAIETMGSDRETVPSVFSVTPCNNKKLWLIEMELCESLSSEESREMKQIMREFHDYEEFSDLSDNTYDLFLSAMNDMDYYTPLSDAMERLIEKSLKETGIVRLDLHADNVMRKNESLVLIDQKETIQSKESLAEIDDKIKQYRKTYMAEKRVNELTL